LKPGWTRFLASISLAALMTLAANAQHSGDDVRQTIVRNHETTLGGLVPGRTSFRQAAAILGKATSGSSWRTRSGNEITVDLDAKQVVQTIRMTQNLSTAQGFSACSGCVSEGRMWKTGLGLRLGSLEDRVIQLYGKPDSRSPSTKGGQQLELLYYAFDWAGSDVPQVMEVLCTVGKNGEPGRVVEITLAASSL
jgi:hypothetical protein